MDVTDQLRGQAMLTIHATAFWSPDEVRLSAISPLSLDEAVRVLAADKTFFAPSLRRRAIAKLSGYRFGQPEVDSALRGLEAPMEAIREALGDHAPSDPVERESIVYDALGSSPREMACATKEFESAVYGTDRNFSLVAKIWVGRTRGEVARALDPQSWKQCSKFWRPPTFLVDHDPSTGAPIESPGGQPKEGAPNAVGMPYSPTPRLFFEHFVCLNGGCEFRNYLWIWAWNGTSAQPFPGSPAYDIWFNFSKQKSGYFQALGLQYPVRIKIDQGQLQAIDDPKGGTRVVTSKTLAFEDPLDTLLAQIAVTQFSELTGELAELVCCVVGP